MSVHEDEFPQLPPNRSASGRTTQPAEDEDLAKASDFPRVEIDLSSAEFDALERLVGRGTYGSTPDDVALYLISRGIDDLVRAGVL